MQGEIDTRDSRGSGHIEEHCAQVPLPAQGQALRSPGVPKAKPRAKRGSKLDAYKEYIDVRLAEGLENCVVLLREIREPGYDGGYSTLKNYVHPRRSRPRQPK